MSRPTPPRLAEALLTRCLPPGKLGESILGDLYEAYVARTSRSRDALRSTSAARLWYWTQALTLSGRYLTRRIFLRELYRRLAGEARQAPGTHAGADTMFDLGRDVSFTLRSLRRNPGFAAATILVLGIGIGAISLMFSTYNAVVLRPLPYPAPSQLVWVWATSPRGGRNSLSYDDYVDYESDVPAFSSLGSYMLFSDRRLLSGTGESQQVTGSIVSASFFSTLGVSPVLGRGFGPDDETRGVEDVAVLSYSLWTNRFGADSTLVGKAITLDGQPVTILGVMPADFDYPADTDLWLPLQQAAGYASGRGNNNFRIIGRLVDGATLQQAQVQMASVAARIAEGYPDAKAGWGVELESLHERLFGSAGNTILLLMAIIALVPLVASANVASLFMARGVTRRAELASRLTLGASRKRLVGQLLTESLVMALAGGALGLLLAYVGGEVLRHLAPSALPRIGSIGVDGTVTAFTLLAALLTVPLFGIAPALRSTDMDIAQTLKAEGGRGTGGGRLSGRRGLVVAQVALSLMLMLASGLLLRGFLNLQSEDPGFRTQDVVYARVSLPAFKYRSRAEANLVWDDVLDHLRRSPSFQIVGAVDRPPISSRGPTNEVWAAQRPPVSAADKDDATRRVVTGEFFEAMGIPVTAGRTFIRQDEGAGQPVVVINQTLARHYFPGEDPVGQTLVLDWDPGINLTVIGVVGDVREAGLDAPPYSTFYLPSWWLPRTEMNVVGRLRGGSTGMVAAWRESIHAVDPDIAIQPVRTFANRLAESLFQPRFRSTLVALFALVSVILSAIGLYGVLAYFVRQHAHELGIRLALGATGREVSRLVITRGMALATWGIVVGLPLGIAAAALARRGGWLPGVDLADPLLYVTVATVLALVSLGACAVPAVRALRLQPVKVMRTE
jgi:predicted permease